jgi:hypothetical protein
MHERKKRRKKRREREREKTSYLLFFLSPASAGAEKESRSKARHIISLFFLVIDSSKMCYIYTHTYLCIYVYGLITEAELISKHIRRKRNLISTIVD